VDEYEDGNEAGDVDEYEDGNEAGDGDMDEDEAEDVDGDVDEDVDGEEDVDEGPNMKNSSIRAALGLPHRNRPGRDTHPNPKGQGLTMGIRHVQKHPQHHWVCSDGKGFIARESAQDHEAAYWEERAKGPPREEVPSHALVVPWPADNLQTWCGRPILDERVADHNIGTVPEAITCEDCKRAMRRALEDLKRQVPRLED